MFLLVGYFISVLGLFLWLFVFVSLLVVVIIALVGCEFIVLA